MNLPNIKDISYYCNISLNKCLPIEERTISYYDLTFVTKGYLDYVVNGEKMRLSENDAILIPPGSKRKRIFAYSWKAFKRARIFKANARRFREFLYS